MARSRRRTSRRTPTQRAAGIIALALPAPVQRVADTRLGSLLMLVGAPILIMFGLLNVTWVDGFPTFKFNHNRAVELKNAATQQINNLENQAISQNWSQTSVDFLHAAQGPNHGHPLPSFPSTRPQTTSSAYNPQQQSYPTQAYGQQTQYSQQQYPASYQQQSQYPTNYQQQQYHYQQPQSQSYQQSYQQGSYTQPYQQQPNYSQGQQGGYSPLQYNSPLPSSNSGQSMYPTQGQYGRY